jgi:energy-coupling factor transporter transmembrane protein EcfT
MHPFVKILLFIFTLFIMSYVNNAYLWAMCIVLCVHAFLSARISFLRLIKRMKWLFLSILIVYGLTTPGEYIQHIPVQISPTVEGVVLGGGQIARLLIALATLNILFSTSSKEQLLNGLHLLLLPLNLLGLNVNRFTARLFLTLDYVEELAVKEKFKFRFDQLENLLSTTLFLEKDKVIELENHPFNWADKLILSILAISTLVIFYFNFIHLAVSV